jgi:hypothetical protein
MSAMIATAPAHLAPPATAAAPLAPRHGVVERHIVCRMLQLHRFCALARCRRTRCCHGAPQRCLATHGPAVPRAVRDFAEAVLVAARYEEVREGDGERWLKKSYRREAAVFEAWIARLESRDARARRYALLARLRRNRKRAPNRA